EGRAGRLRVGRYVLIDRLGRSRSSATFLARPIDGGPPCALKEITVSAERRADVGERLRRLAAAACELRSRCVVAPHEVYDHGHGFAAVSRLAPGTDARTWLIRHGRFAAPAVAEIARQ